jgi:GT2 family glycosyltransferase
MLSRSIIRRVAGISKAIHRYVRRLRRPAAPTAQLVMHAYSLAAAEANPTPLAAPRVGFIVPVYNTAPEYLDALVASLRLQRAGSWQLVLSDDGSTAPKTCAWLQQHASDVDLVILRHADNRGIAAATNAGLSAVSAPWVGLLDHDDALAPYALDRIVRALDDHPDCAFLYTDEVIADDRLQPMDVFLKPAFDPVLLSGVNYINHLSVFRRNRLIAVGGLREGFDGSQDYDLVLRYTADLPRETCLHLPYPAYIWRRDGKSFSIRHQERAVAAARRALREAYGRPAAPALSDDLHRVRFDGGEREWPLVSIIIPSRDGFDLIERVLRGLVEETDYPTLEVIVVDNGSTDPRVLALYERYRQGTVPFRAEIKPEPFNFSRSTNRGLALAKGSFLLLLNNDVEILEPGWLKEMVSCFDYADTGIVGSRLLYPDRTIQHAGVIVGFGELAGHWYLRRAADFPGPMGRLRVRQSLSCVTGACLLMSRRTLEAVGPLDEDAFAIAYNDVDLCLRAVAAGLRVVWTPFATLIHHESATRGNDETARNVARFREEQRNLRQRHRTDDFPDRAISPWYSKDRSEPVPRLLPHLPCVR